MLSSLGQLVSVAVVRWAGPGLQDQKLQSIFSRFLLLVKGVFLLVIKRHEPTEADTVFCVVDGGY